MQTRWCEADVKFIMYTLLVHCITGTDSRGGGMVYRLTIYIDFRVNVVMKYINTLTGYLTGYTLPVHLSWTPFSYQTSLILCARNIPYTWSWLTWWHHTVASDFLAVHPWFDLLFQHVLLECDLVTMEAVWVKWTDCHVQEGSVRWFELCDVAHYPAGSTHEKICTL